MITVTRQPIRRPVCLDCHLQLKGRMEQKLQRRRVEFQRVSARLDAKMKRGQTSARSRSETVSTYHEPIDTASDRCVLLAPGTLELFIHVLIGAC